jgi:hypothetical protein
MEDGDEREYRGRSGGRRVAEIRLDIKPLGRQLDDVRPLIHSRNFLARHCRGVTERCPGSALCCSGMTPSLLRGSAVTALVLLLIAAPVAAQEVRPQVDPDSPAGTEYALPLDQAMRSGAAPSTPSSGDEARGAASSKALFGTGIASPAKSISDGSGGSPQPTAGSSDARAGSSGARAKGSPDRAVTAATQPSGSALRWLLGSGFLVLVLGAALSVALRRAAGRS